MGFFQRFIWIFTAPAKVFADIREGRAPWWQPWIWMSLITVIMAFFAKPIQIAVMELNPNNHPPEQVEREMEIFEKYGQWLQIGLTPVILLVVTLIVAGLTYIVVSVLCSKANFMKFFKITLYAGIVSSVSTVLSTAVLRMRGVDAIRSVDDARFSIGLGFLAPEEGNLVRAALYSFDFFAIWSLVLVVLGLMHVFGMQVRQAIYCVIPMWLISVAMLTIQEVVGGIG